MAKRGRKKIELDEEEIKKLAGLGCTVEEIANFFGVGKRTLERNYGAAINKGRECVKINLKKKQYDIAMKGNVKMLIWLGIQYLEQRNKIVEKGEHSVLVKIRKMKK
jgi:hypothetical protein